MTDTTDWPSLRGELAADIRDWAQTPLGATSDWPQGLRAAILVMLDNPEPAFVFWGAELRVFYNDAYRKLVGDRHSEALGAPLERIWPDFVLEARARIDAVGKGEAQVFPEKEYVVPALDGGTRRRWFRETWLPLRDDAGDIRGITGMATETTDRVLEELARREATDALRENQTRAAFLHRVSDALRAQTDARAAMRTAAEILGGHLGIAFVGYAEVDAAGQVRTEAAYHAQGRVPAVGGRSLNLEHLGAKTAARLHKGEPVSVPDILAAEGFTDEYRRMVGELGVRSYMVAPVFSTGRPDAYLFAAHDGPRVWSEREIALLCDTAERTYDAVKRARTEEVSQATESRYRTLFEAIDEGFCILELRFDDPDGRTDYRVVEANPAFYGRTGFPKEILGRWLRDAAPDLEEHWYETYGRVARTGEPTRFEQESKMLGRWFDVYAFRLGAEEDRRVGILFNDISERKRHEEQTGMLMRELNHRSKNMLTLVQAIARQTAFSGTDDFLGSFGKRMQALSAAQDLLIEHAWKAVPVADLVRTQLSHFYDLIDTRIEIGGPPLSLAPDATQALGLALHELATNAAKYGALSNETGRIAVRWSVAQQPAAEEIFEMSWLERDGPPVARPVRHGFGSKVTIDMVEASTGGKVSLDYAPPGLAWRFSCPAASVLDGAQIETGAAQAAQADAVADDPTCHRVLVVEDEPLIAADMALMLADAGFSVLGPARFVGQALSLIEARGCDVAVLDANLGRETSEPVAQTLIEAGTPFVVVSGYSREQLPEVLRNAALLGKPMPPGVLQDAVRQALRRQPA